MLDDIDRKTTEMARWSPWGASTTTLAGSCDSCQCGGCDECTPNKLDMMSVCTSLTNDSDCTDLGPSRILTGLLGLRVSDLPCQRETCAAKFQDGVGREGELSSDALSADSGVPMSDFSEEFNVTLCEGCDRYHESPSDSYVGQITDSDDKHLQRCSCGNEISTAVHSSDFGEIETVDRCRLVEQDRYELDLLSTDTGRSMREHNNTVASKMEHGAEDDDPDGEIGLAEEATIMHCVNVEDAPSSDKQDTGCRRCCKTSSNTRSYIAVFCCFSIMFLTVGIMSSFGVFYVELLDYYGNSPSSTSIIGSINAGVCHAAAPLVGLLEAKIGIRRTVIVGALLSAIGLAGSSFVTSMVILYFTYGIISGTGFAIAYTASIGMLASHFDCQRSLDIAMGISTSGMGFGVLALPPLIRLVIGVYGWRGAILLCGGMALNICVFAALSGPPKEKNNVLVRTLSMMSVTYTNTEKNKSQKGGLSVSISRDDSEEQKETLMSVVVEEKDTAVKKNVVYTTSETDVTPPQRSWTRWMMPWKKCHHLSILGNKAFVIVLLSEILSNMTIGSVLTTLPDFAHRNGHSLFRASLLLSIYGTTATIGRLYLSLFSAAVRKFKSNKRATITATNFITMLSVLCIGFAGDSYYLIGLWVGLFGIATGAKGTFVYCFVIKQLGAKHTVTAMGLVGLSCGIGQFGGPPLAGILFSKTLWYPVVYCFGGFTSLLAALLILIVVVMHIRDRRRKDSLKEDLELSKQDGFLL